MPDGAGEIYVETLRFNMQYLQALPLSCAGIGSLPGVSRVWRNFSSGGASGPEEGLLIQVVLQRGQVQQHFA